MELKKNISILDDSDDALQSECSICLDNMCTHTHSVCGGIFCGSCVANIVQETSVCPTCRRSFKSASEILKIIPLSNGMYGDEYVKPSEGSWNEKLTTELLQQEIDTWSPKKKESKEESKEESRVEKIVKTLNGVEHKIYLFPSMPAPRLKGAIALASGMCAEEIELVFGGDSITCKKVQSLDQEEEDQEWYQEGERKEKKKKLTLLGLQEEVDQWSSEKEEI